MIGLALLLALSASAGLATQENWNVTLSAYVGCVGCSPQDVGNYLGAHPSATDGWDLGIDSKKPPMPPGEYVWLWFNRPTWGQGDVAGDYRSPIDEGTSKVWGTGFTDTTNVKVKLTQPGSGVMDDCGWGIEYPVASTVYLVWQIGVGVDKDPPEDYIITLEYKSGINAKPDGTGPVGVSVPTPGQTWDMRTISELALPLWHETFSPPNAECTDLAVPDTAKFKIIVENPGVTMSCNITFSPDSPAVDEAVSFNGNVTGGTAPYSYDWDFGDGGSSTEAAPSHTYTAGGTFTVSLTVTDDTLATTSCDTTVDVNWPPTCNISADPAEPMSLDLVQFQSGAQDQDGTVVSYAWSFGDGGTSTNASPTHTYATPGTKTVSLTVTDNLGATGNCSLPLEVGNRNPTCYITYTPLAPTVDDLISFNSHATDPDGTVVSVTWDFGDTNSGSGVTTDHQYSTAATYTVSVTVVDNSGGEGTCSEQVEVGPTVSDDTPPLLTITSPAPGATVSGDLTAGWLAADASDPDTGVAKVEFFLDGKLIGTDTVGPTSYQAPGINSALYANGTHYVGARATNGDSLTTDKSFAVAISNPVDPEIYPVIRQTVVRTELILPARQIRVNLTITNLGFSADNVTVEGFKFVASYRDPDTGELVLKDIVANPHPDTGETFPWNLGTIANGESRVLDILSEPVPVQYTHVRRWMDYGTYTKTGEPTPEYNL
ncbi:hypothetical protein AMK68_00410 [candidate division KD3-62 bacterium DG_56]|uniref:PKD domain-containing protein n=1 Tax=candidate division KD3-62 bacterium DG_56 TaxID=1704032 RepID=A0A0S7XQP0_9BACT|nr:MAG: hypothetical protein AMK68_00410 [candidate division KD3-62 bacterium DG_56]